MASVRTTRAPQDEYGGVIAFVAGSGILLMQLCAVIVGLLPGLLVTLALVLPFVALGLLVAVPVGIWRLVTARTPASS